MTNADFLAIDWGTTNRRIFALSKDGRAVSKTVDDLGVVAVTEPYPKMIADIRATYGDLPILAAGMIGSTRGWKEAPYVPCPASMDVIAHELEWVEPGRTSIVPGVKCDDPFRPDVMRGEEVQILGAVEAGLVPKDASVCQPGTHSKWVELEGGGIVRFHSAMTGELFALLRKHSLLASQMDGEVRSGKDFEIGLNLAAVDGALRSLFGERAGVLLGNRDPKGSAARISGLLIGQEVADASIRKGQAVHILAGPELGTLYAAAISKAGGVPNLISSETAFLAGITSIWKRIA